MTSGREHLDAAPTSNARQDAGMAAAPSAGQPIGVRAVLPGVLLALLVRAAYLAETAEVPTVRHLVGDAAGYVAWAERIAAGDWIGQEGFYQAPLYPYALASLFHLFGAHVWLVRLVQAMLGTAAAGCLGYGTALLFGVRAGRMAGIMAALYAPTLFFDGIIQKASLTGLLTSAVFLATAWTMAAQRAASFLVVGVLGGLLVLTRENAMVWLLVLGGWIALRRHRCGTRRRWRGVASYAAGVAVVLIPVGVRNAVVSGQWSVSTFQAGANFYIGNHAGADGRYQPFIRGHETPPFERRDASRLAADALGRELTASEVSRYWAERALVDIRAEPMRWLRLMGRKVLLVCNRHEIADAESQYVYAEHSRALRLLTTVWHWGVMCPLAAIGIVETWGERRRLWVYHAMLVSMVLAVALFFVLARYRYPVAILLIPFAAVGLVHIGSQLRARRYRVLLGKGLLAGMIAVLVNVPVQDERRLNAMAHMNVGVALAQAGEVEAATAYFKSAVDGHPTSAEAHNNLAQALALLGRYDDAIPHYEAAVTIEPALIGLCYNLAVALERVGRLEAAFEHYERAVEQDPGDVGAIRAVARLRGAGVTPHRKE